MLQLTEMAGKITAAFIAFVAVAFIANLEHVACNPAIGKYLPLHYYYYYLTEIKPHAHLLVGLLCNQVHL